MIGCKSDEKKRFLWKKKRNASKNVTSFGDLITAEVLEIKPKKQTKSRQNVEEKELNGSDPFNLSSKDIDAAIIQFLKKVKYFQDRASKENPVKAKSKHRLVFGLREVRKQLMMETVGCVVLACDIEVNKKDDLVGEIDMIKQLCSSKHIDILWISSKRILGKTLKKWPIVSAVAILDYRGAEDLYGATMQKVAIFTACCQIANHIDQSSLFA